MTHDICRFDEIPDGSIKVVRVERRDLVLVRRGEHVYCVRDICPHQGAKLSGGTLTAARESDGVGDYRLSRCGLILRCPWHNWEYDVTDGSCLADPQHTRIATYVVEIREGRVCVTI